MFGSWTGYVLNLTSQKWLDPSIVSRSEWWHQLLVIVPDNVEVLDTSVLWIAGGYNGEDDDEVAIDSFDVHLWLILLLPTE